ncbi:MAG: hypothetical protein AAFP28_03390 [Pseudomonadota bacterium]
MTLEIAPGEAGLIRVFALSMTEAEAKELLTDYVEGDAPLPIDTALGTRQVDTDFVEVFPVADLEGVGLAGYLTEGNDAAEDEIAQDRAKLDALEGYVLIVFSAAFDRVAQTLAPQPELTLIGTYRQEGVDYTPVAVTSEAAELYTAPQKKPMSEARISGMVATAVLLFLAIFVVIFVLIGG